MGEVQGSGFRVWGLWLRGSGFLKGIYRGSFKGIQKDSVRDL